MESKTSEVGRTAIGVPLKSRTAPDPPLGEQLEAVHSSRLRAQTAHDLLDYYIQFSRDDTTNLDTLHKDGGKEGRLWVAVLLRRLSTMAKDVDIPVAEKVGDQTGVRKANPHNERIDARKYRQILREVREGYARPL
jgi:hypothetical protein